MWVRLGRRIEMTRSMSAFVPALSGCARMACLLLALGTPVQGHACDLCAIYTATEQRESRTGIRVGVAEQFTSSNTLQQSGEKVDNPAGQRLNSSITQFLAGYNFTPRIGLQLNLPLITRAFRRVEGMDVVNGDESGIGDLSLIVNGEAYRGVTEDSVIRLSLLGGLKLPSGNSRRLKEELAGSHQGDHEMPGMNAVPSAVHGHDLALGSGSTDGVLGAQLFWSRQRMFVTGAVQYLLRTEGDFKYEYANDLMWSGGPGVFALLDHSYSLGVQAVVSGESKGKDDLAGTRQNDTALTALFVGPSVLFTWGMTAGAELAVDVPFEQNNSALQLVRDYRLRGGFTWRF